MYKFLLFLLPLLFWGCSAEHRTTNIPPVADAGLFQYLDVGSTVYLDGSASSDKDGDALSYQWTMISKPVGSSAQLSSSSSISPHFTSDKEGNYVIQLVVNDGKIDSKPDQVTINTLTFVEANSSAPQMSNQIYTPSSNTMSGRPMLVIRLDFDDQTFISPATTWQQKLFGSNAGELNNYYHEISQNQFEFVPVADEGNVTNGITTVHLHYNHPDPDINSNTFDADLDPSLKQAIETVSASGFNFSVYDTDGNNAITPDELIITFIMAGSEDAYDGGVTNNGVWAHQWCTEDTYTPTVNGVDVMGCSTDGNYAIFGERHHDSPSVSHDASVGIIAHELGHSTFGLPDLYNTNSGRGGIGYYGLMANGAWGQIGNSGVPGDTPTHMCAWSKIDTGWYTPSSDSNNTDTNLQVHATGTASYNIIKTPVNNSTDEYFLVENRSDTGYDAGLKYVNNSYNGGMAIWHIDESVINAKRPDNIINNSTSHKGVDLEEAAGDSLDNTTGDPLLNLYYSGNVDAFTPNTQPNTNLYTNARSLIFFTNISASSNTMTVRINNPQ